MGCSEVDILFHAQNRNVKIYIQSLTKEYILLFKNTAIIVKPRKV